MCIFYDPRGNEIDMDTFISFYSRCYYLNNSAVVEARIDELLCAESLTRQDVMLIIEWKLGRIDHKKSQAARDHICFRHEAEAARFQTATRSGKIDARKLCETVSDDLPQLRQQLQQLEPQQKPQKLLQTLKSLDTRYFGTVYLITLLYFMTQGEYPIYDRFAMMALEAISKGERPGAEIPYRDLPSKSESGFDLLLDADAQKSKYRAYIYLLESVFGTRYTKKKKDRDIDRALWVYGHLFQQTKDSK